MRGESGLVGRGVPLLAGVCPALDEAVLTSLTPCDTGAGTGWRIISSITDGAMYENPCGFIQGKFRVVQGLG